MQLPELSIQGGDFVAKENNLLSGQLYDPSMGEYNLPIFDNDNMFASYTLRLFIDTLVANYGHNVTKNDVVNHFLDIKSMLMTDARETLDLCMDSILKEVNSTC